MGIQNRKKDHSCLTDEPVNNLMLTAMKPLVRDSDEIINRACDFLGESKKRRKLITLHVLVQSFSVLPSCFGVSTAYIVKLSR